MANELHDLYKALKPDEWRKTNAFSGDIKLVQDLFFDPFATDGERKEQLAHWLQGVGNQPCLFGRIAAANDWIHYCILTGDDFIEKSDEEIAQEIEKSLIAWKRRSVRPTANFSTPAFGFVLIAVSQALAAAAPDEHLLAFSTKLLELWGAAKTHEKPSGDMNWETLYLQNPDTKDYYRFTFSVDFFCAQGDKRWWHDHRSPGGLMFTANSVGHMKRYREWYEKKKDQSDWMLEVAMLTIANSAKTDYGKATWLRGLDGGKPIESGVACPFSNPAQIKKPLVDKDWSKYAGWLHTDHAIRREEFFNSAPAPSPEIGSRVYMEDFTYLYDPKLQDNLRFVQGEKVSEEEIAEKIGTVDTWRELYQTPRRIIKFGPPKAEDEKRIKALLEEGRKWRLSKEELAELSL